MMDGNLVTAHAAAQPKRSGFATAAWVLWAISVLVVVGAIIVGAMVAARPGGGEHKSLAILLAPTRAALYFGPLNLLGVVAGAISLVRPARGAPIALALNAFGVLLALYAVAIHLVP